MEPADFLCDLVDGHVQDQLDAHAFRSLDAALRNDSFTQEEYAVLAQLAPLIAERHPGHPFSARIQGVRRRVRVGVAASQALVSTVRAHTGEGILLGDLAAAQAFYPDPSERPVTASTWVVPGLRRAQAWQLARTVAAESGADVLPGHWPILRRHGVRLTLHRSLSTAFDFPRAQRIIDGSAELILYNSLVASALGAPRISWYSDAVRANIDWDRVWGIAHEAGWVEPMARAAAFLNFKGRDVPVRQEADSLMDSAYFRQPLNASASRMWLVLRLTRHGGLPGALR